MRYLLIIHGDNADNIFSFLLVIFYVCHSPFCFLHSHLVFPAFQTQLCRWSPGHTSHAPSFSCLLWLMQRKTLESISVSQFILIPVVFSFFFFCSSPSRVITLCFGRSTTFSTTFIAFQSVCHSLILWRQKICKMLKE